MRNYSFILGKIPESTSEAGQIDWNGVLKVVRLSIVVGIAGVLGSIAAQLPMLDILPDSTFDETFITLVLVPLVEATRRWATDYSS